MNFYLDFCSEILHFSVTTWNFRLLAYRWQHCTMIAPSMFNMKPSSYLFLFLCFRSCVSQCCHSYTNSQELQLATLRRLDTKSCLSSRQRTPSQEQCCNDKIGYVRVWNLESPTLFTWSRPIKLQPTPKFNEIQFWSTCRCKCIVWHPT